MYIIYLTISSLVEQDDYSGNAYAISSFKMTKKITICEKKGPETY